MNNRDVVVVDSVRTGLAKSFRGSFNLTRSDDMLAHCMDALLDRNGAVSHQYSVMATPWPVSDRDNVLRSVLSRDTETGVVEITVTADPDHYPEQPDRVRVRRAKGLWRFEPLSESRTRVTFQMHLEPGGGIPQWMINARVVATPFEALGNLREMVAR